MIGDLLLSEAQFGHDSEQIPDLAPSQFKHATTRMYDFLLEFVFVYIDDILIGSVNSEMHKIERLVKHGLNIKTFKCRRGHHYKCYCGMRDFVLSQTIETQGLSRYN